MNLFYTILVKIFYKVIHSERYRVYCQHEMNKWAEMNFASFGGSAHFQDVKYIKNSKYISVGKKFSSLYNLRLEAWDNYMGESFLPKIIIGDNVNFNSDIHISAVNAVSIGNNVLMASHIYISDHSHGEITSQNLEFSPSNRRLFSKGQVIIEDNVWIGTGVCILPGVTIGKNSIIGANSVVNTSFPPNSVIGGVPAKLIKQL